MKKFLYKKEFLRTFDCYKEAEKELIIMAEKQIRHYYLKQTAPYGLRIKKLFEKKEEKTFEARVSDKIRLLYVESKELVVFAFLGNHDEVKKYIKSFR
ncbi:MAG: hypothetical protein Q8N09_02630 [Thermodesulfovibrionia bacterium]|nr:hypothetical protein [Thermodesulfovibrionia bacterium]